MGTVVYAGYVDDPRNTDNAWMETTVMHYEMGAELNEFVKLPATHNGLTFRWIDVDKNDWDYAFNFFDAHKEWVDRVLLHHHGKQTSKGHGDHGASVGRALKAVLDARIAEATRTAQLAHARQGAPPKPETYSTNALPTMSRFTIGEVVQEVSARAASKVKRSQGEEALDLVALSKLFDL